MMKLKPAEREAIRLMFGGMCSYCGVALDGKWHVDHCEAVRRNGSFVGGKWKTDGTMLEPHHDCRENLFPACVRCNILKADANVEGFRSMLTYFANSIPRIAGYSHVHHLIRFKKLHIDETPVAFWFETYLAEQGHKGAANGR